MTETRKHKKKGTDVASLPLPKKLNAKTKSKQKTQIMIINLCYFFCSFMNIFPNFVSASLYL